MSRDFFLIGNYLESIIYIHEAIVDIIFSIIYQSVFFFPIFAVLCWCAFTQKNECQKKSDWAKPFDLELNTFTMRLSSSSSSSNSSNKTTTISSGLRLPRSTLTLSTWVKANKQSYLPVWSRFSISCFFSYCCFVWFCFVSVFRVFFRRVVFSLTPSISTIQY